MFSQPFTHPFVHPVFAAKSIITADHVSEGRVGLNIVSGWHPGEFAMFGKALAPHDERYAFSEEWVSIVRRMWSQETAFSFKGRYFDLEGVTSKPQPWLGQHPVLMSAGSSATGRTFAARHADCLFMSIADDLRLREEVSAIRIQAGRDVRIYGSSHFLARATEKETRDYYHYLVHEHGDWEAAEAAIERRLAGDSRSLPPGRLHEMKERFISGGGTYPIIGSYDQVAEKFLALSKAGIDGMAVACVNYVNASQVLRDEILPRLERLKIRAQLR